MGEPSTAEKVIVDTNSNVEAIKEHPLQTGWALWYDRKMPKKTDLSAYQSNLRKVGAFSTVEEFWRHFLHVKRPSELGRDTNLYLFRDAPDVKPMWEAFPKGGCWILKIKKKANVSGKMWQDLVFASIGEIFEEPTMVGVGIACRSKEDMISVWNSTNDNEEIRFRIGEKLREILNLDSNTLVEYKYHAKSLEDMSTFRNAKPYVFAAAEQEKSAAKVGKRYISNYGHNMHNDMMRDSGKVEVAEYDDHGFVINNINYRGSVFVLPSGVTMWKPKTFEEITTASLKLAEMMSPPIDLLLIGSGKKIRHDLDTGTRDFLKYRGIQVEVLDTANCCATFNILNAEDRIVAAAMVTIEPAPDRKTHEEMDSILHGMHRISKQ